MPSTPEPGALAWLADLSEQDLARVPADLRARLAAARAAAAEISALAWRDPLTGLWNRRALESLAAAQLAQARRYCEPLALLLFDIDRFKGVNDRRGHPAGDAVLGAVARALVEVSRASDVVARFGGDEFAVLLPRTAEEGAAAARDRLVAAVAAAAEVTISAGMGVLAAGEEADWPELLARADRDLYARKRPT